MTDEEKPAFDPTQLQAALDRIFEEQRSLERRLQQAIQIELDDFRCRTNLFVRQVYVDLISSQRIGASKAEWFLHAVKTEVDFEKLP